MKINILFLFILFCFIAKAENNPVADLVERIDKGASKHFIFEIVPTSDNVDFFELDQHKKKVVIRGNNYISIATGLNWYLKYYANIHISWNGMQAKLPKTLPPVKTKERHETTHQLRYYLNYCTYSYSMPFWDWERWQQEIDWMALHGINLCLSLTGTETVWFNLLEKLGYTEKEINEFIAGPAFLAWWHMNNLEGWGGPNSKEWYSKQAKLQEKILQRFKEYGIEPVLPGYSGMLPSNINEKTELTVTNPGTWINFKRPAFLQPTDPSFDKIAQLYYEELNNLYGKVKYYSMDPFHEGGSTQGVDLPLAGKTMMQAMKKNNPESVWVIQAWQANPREEMIKGLKQGDLLILDLFSESRPAWGPKWSSWAKPERYENHEWIFCMLHNFGGRTGMMGKMDYVIKGYFEAAKHPSGKTLKGIGATMEAIESDPVMYELLFELPWRSEEPNITQWVKDYTKLRYGKTDKNLEEAWEILHKTVYSCPTRSVQEGTSESVLAARPRLEVKNVSSWSTTKIYYNADSLRLAAEKMVEVANQYKGNNNFEYDLVNTVRQAITNKAYYLQKEVTAAYEEKNIEKFKKLKDEFLTLILVQDSLLATRPEFMVGSWINRAYQYGDTDYEKTLFIRNAKNQITLWGTRESAEKGLNDYAYKEWNGILKDYYYERWNAFFNYLEEKLKGNNPDEIDFIKMGERWINKDKIYPHEAQACPIERATEIFLHYLQE